MLLKALILGLLVRASANFLSLKTQAITRCVSESCESGVGLYPHCADCDKFIYCVFGHPIQKQCPLGLKFDIVRGVCNFPHNSTCWNANTGNRIGLQNTGLFSDSNLKLRDDRNTGSFINSHGANSGSTHYFSNGKSVAQIPSDAVSRQVPNHPDVDVSQPPVSMMTDDPPVGFDEDGHETQAPSNAFQKDFQPELPVSKNKNRLPDTDVSQPPVSMMTDDPPVGFDEDGHEIQAPYNTFGQDTQQDLTDKEIKLLPDGDVSEPPVSMMTDDPPIGFDENGHETQAPFKSQNKQESVSGIEQKPVENQQRLFPLEDVSKPPISSENEEEEQNRDFTINPDFDEGAQSSLLNSQSEDWKNMFAKLNMPGFAGIDLQNPPSGQPVQISNGQTSEVEKIALSTGKGSAISANGKSSSVSANEKSSAVSANEQSSAESANEQRSTVVSSGQSNSATVQVPCVTNCQGLPSGNYQSCNGCDSYMVCMMGLQFLTPCPDATRWDDITKHCSQSSTTCY